MKISSRKVAVNQLPAAGRIHGALACEYGALRHGGEYNYRDPNHFMDYMVILDAIERHVMCLVDGEDLAPDSLVHHLGHIIADASMGLDAIERDRMNDNRPLPGTAAALIERTKKDAEKEG